MENDAGHPEEDGSPALARIGQSKKVNQAGVKAITGTGTKRTCGSGACIRRSISRTTVAEKYRSPQRGQTRAGTASKM